ncbi:MAG: hypothetical protein NVS4B7_08330 [Ktedonobacteraceae bacterium]
MNKHKQFDSSAGEHAKLARWLQHVLTQPLQEQSSQSGVSLNSDYHPRFYQQLPDFVMALLQNEPQATIHYAPLLYHLAGCTTCHTAYLELYDAMRYALKSGASHPTVNQGTRPLATIPTATLVNLCQLLISQAEAVLHQAHHDHSDGNTLARSLLQLAMRVSTHILQSSMRTKALKDLVRVATLFDGPHSPAEQQPATYSYSPLVGASGGPRHGKVVRRGVDTPVRSVEKSTESSIIYLQSHSLEGSITQRGNLLELHLQDLDETLRGHYLTLAVPLGSLIEPVRWRGGNPRAIRSEGPVAPDGTLSTALGQTDLQLNNAEERNLLEVMFSLLEVRPVNTHD